MKRWQLTSHAVDRYIERIAPDLTAERAAQEMRRALGGADRDRLAGHVDLLLTLLAEERQRRLPGQANGARGASSP